MRVSSRREQAERCRRLAAATSDERIVPDLLATAIELGDEADREEELPFADSPPAF